MTSSSFKLLRDSVLAFGVAIGAFAQTMGTGTISGTVTDASGGVVSTVQITATNVDTGIARSTVTNSSGAYVLPTMQVGRYRVRALHEGFKAVTQDDVRLDVDTTIAVNFTLQVGSTEQTVEVTATPPAIQTTTSEMGTVATGAQVSELSFNGRNFSQILTLGTGIASQNTGRRMGVGQEGNPLMSVNGGRINATKFTYDGVLA